MEAHYEGFSIREYTRNVRSVVDIRKCCPFPGEFTGDFIHLLLPPFTVTKFRWWSHELTSLLTESPDDGPNAESSSCKKRSIGETTTNDLVLHKKKIKTKKLDDTFPAQTDNKVTTCEEQARERGDDDEKRSLGIKERSGVMSPSINKAVVRCFSYTDEELVSQDCDSELQIPRTLKVAKRKVCSVRSPDDKPSVDASQCEEQVRFSLQLCCSQMNRLSLSSAAEDQSPKVMSNDKTSDNMLLESVHLNKHQPVVSERRLSHARAESSMSCYPGPHLTLERIKDALDLERTRHVSQPNQSSISTSSEIHRCNFVDLSGGTESELATDVGRFTVHNVKHNKYYPARLGLDETFTENAFFISDTNDGERGHTINLPKQGALSQNLNSRNMVATPDGLCLHDTQSTMRLMGKDVSVGTSYSEDASIDYSFVGSYAHQSWLWQTTTLEENHSMASLDKSWNTTLLCDTSKDPFPMFCEPPKVVPDSELPPTFFYPCGSLMSADKDLYFHESSLGQQLNSVTFSQQQLPGLPSAYRNVGAVGLLPDAREPSFGLPFTSTTQSQLHWPQSSFESSRLDMLSITPAELN